MGVVDFGITTSWYPKMLPDFPHLKGRLRTILNERLRRTAYGGGVVSRIRRFQAHEGQGFSIQRLDGSTDQTEFVEKSVDFTLTKEELKSLSPQQLIDKVDQAAGEMSKKTTDHIFSEMHKATSHSGNIVNAEGQPFSAELFLKGLEMMQIDFDDKGEISGLTVVVPPQVGQRLPELFDQWEKDTDFKRRYDELLTKKREAWRDRESRRKLVD